MPARGDNQKEKEKESLGEAQAMASAVASAVAVALAGAEAHEKCMYCGKGEMESDEIDWVSCGTCRGWAHYSCAGVDANIVDLDWFCPKHEPLVAQQLVVPKSGRPRSKSTKSAKSDSGSVRGTDGAEITDKQFEDEQKARERDFMKQMEIRQKRLQVELEWQNKQMEMERRFREQEIEAKKQLHDAALKQEQELLDNQMKAEREFLRKRDEIRSNVKSSLNRVKDLQDERGAEGHTGDKKPFTKVTSQDAQTQDRRGAFQKGGKPQLVDPKFNLPPPGANEEDDERSSDEEDDDGKKEEPPKKDEDARSHRSHHSDQSGGSPDGPGNNAFRLTRDQIAMRKVVSKKMPPFNGDPEHWPQFISYFESTTKACGFSNLENFDRLLNCLEGEAAEAVSTTLVFADSVPEVIEDLRRLFGQPEMLLTKLLTKAKNATAPNKGKPETFTHFGLKVKQLCDHLEAANLQEHLNNPMLVNQLALKLPPNERFDWIEYKEGKQGTPLKVFAAFVTRLGEVGAKAAAYAAIASCIEPTPKEKPAKVPAKPFKKKEFVNVHSSTPKGSSEGKQQERTSKPCWICNRTDHKIRYCDDFRKMNVGDRLKAVDQQKLCCICLNKHGDNPCNSKFRCSTCNGNHNSLLHRAEETVQLQQIICNAHEDVERSVIFRVAPVTLRDGNKQYQTLAFLDEGSSATLVEDTIAKLLGVKGIPEALIVSWTGNINRVENDSEKIDLSISAQGGNELIRMDNVRTVSELVLPQQAMKFAELVKRYSHLAGLPVKDYQASQAQILIGLDNLHLFAPLESRVGKRDEPIAVRSKIGWTVYGPERRKPRATTYLNLHRIEPASNQQLHNMMREQYMLDETGVSSFAVPESEEEKRAKTILQTTTKLVGERYETGLLWRKDERSFPDSYPLAERRMKALDRKLQKDPALRENVCRQIEDYQVKGYAHKITEAELQNTPKEAIWYLPLNVVLNPKKPGKVRLVWDAAASIGGVSLNSELLKGPDMLVPLPKVLCQFRERPIAFGGDIQEMYHQLRICTKDRQAQRFLFRVDPSKAPEIFVMDAATFGSTCSPCSAQFVKNKNAERFVEEYPEAAAAIIQKHYVDDYFDSVDTIEEAIQRAKEVKYIHSQGGFHIRNWVSNSAAVLEALGERSGTMAVHFNREQGPEMERVLGVVWESAGDFLYFATLDKAEFAKMLTGDERPTKRNVLSFVMAQFDPTGLISPITVRGKMLMQDLWRTGCNWDDRIDDVSYEKWLRWVRMMRDIGSFQVPRCYFGDAKSHEIEDLQLHVFVDASETAYGCVAYFRAVVRGEVRCALVMSRSKVAPLKMVSIPRLELLAAVLGARLARWVIENHSFKINKVVYWTDSNVVLSWIRSDQRRYKVFVGFRIGEILSLTSLTEWQKVPTKLNIADLLTKWGKDPEMHKESAWVRGPEFLYESEQKWPSQKLPPTDTTEELRVHLLVHDVKTPGILIDVTRISKWTVLVRTMASVLRFVSNCRRKAKGLPIETLKPTLRQQQATKLKVAAAVRVPLRQNEYKKAERCLLRMAQTEGFSDEVKVLQRNKNRPTNEWLTVERSSPLSKLTPLIDEDGLIRMEGRCERAEQLPFDLRFPVVLPADSKITMKIIQYYHEKCGHGYRQTVKNKLRQLYFVVREDAVVKKVSSACVWCKVHRNRPKIPREAPLPLQRLTADLRPFSFVGVDYMGPFNVTVGRRSEKRWIALFTCLATRAVHLEVAHGLTTQSCLMAISRFIGRRGWPIEFLSDNGTNFQGASKELIAEVRSIELDCADEYTNARTKWTFNPAATPHMGGVWERLVRSVKEALKALDDGRRLTDEILQTAIVEAEDIINSRPLTYVSQDSTEVDALTPNHFLRGPPSNPREKVASNPHPATALRDTYHRSQQVASEMWKRWINEYIPTLNRRTKWFGEERPLRAGDLVYIVEGNTRKSWVRGVVDEPIVSSDGRIRQAWVRTNTKRYRRAAANLAVLEIEDGNSEPEEGSGSGLRAGECSDQPGVLQPDGHKNTRQERESK